MAGAWETGRSADVEIGGVRSQADLARIVGEMRLDLLRSPGEWENETLDRFLDALAAFVADTRTVESPTWEWVALILVAASGYE